MSMNDRRLKELEEKGYIPDREDGGVRGGYIPERGDAGPPPTGGSGAGGGDKDKDDD